MVDVVFGRDAGVDKDKAASDEIIADAVNEIVRRQAEIGIDIVSDGELSKISYATYIKDRITGFGGESFREPAQDLLDYPGVLRRREESGTRSKARPPRCIGEIRAKSMEPLETDLANLKHAIEQAPPVEAFMSAAAPGVIALFQPNDYYPSHEAYLDALADAMQAEYEDIVEAGFLLQIDSPDIGMGRHTIFRDQSDDEYLRLANLHIEVLNHALRNIPADRIRLHVSPTISDINSDNTVDGIPGNGDEFFETVSTGGGELVVGEVSIRKDELDTIFRTSLVITF